MYHSIWKKSHYQVGLRYGSMFTVNPLSHFERSAEKTAFTQKCIPLYQKYYAEILEEMKGISEGLHMQWKTVAESLFTMYCFAPQNRCSSFAFCSNGKTILAKNSDFLTFVKKLCDSPYYSIEGGYRFVGNTTAWTEIEDGMNEHGLAVALTFVYPTQIMPGLNAGMLVRYILEKCKTTQQAIKVLQEFPIASAQTIILADRTGDIALVECNCQKVNVIIPQQNKNVVFATNHFISDTMKVYQYHGEDDCYSHKRYETLSYAFENNYDISLQFVMDLLSGKKGFLCQYDKSEGIDTIWSSIYDLTEHKIYRAEGNPKTKSFREDNRLQKRK